MIKEACIENFAEALAAQQAGANRVELCENLQVGGTTPSFGTIKMCVEKLAIPAFVMIRPRGGNFVYSPDELEIMKSDIDICKQLGVPAVVFGLLTPTGEIDVKKTRELIERARPMQVTFHKAFDELTDPLAGMEILIRIGADRILTSGTKATAEEGMDMLNQLIEKASGRITIVAAGKVTKENLPELSKLIRTDEFHGKKIV
ncbi:MAG: copper homeostasis protein CutC [Mangrovibacterium sp.]